MRRIVREVGFWLPLVFVLLTLLLSAGFVKVMELGQGRRDLERADRQGRSSARSIPGSHLPAGPFKELAKLPEGTQVEVEDLLTLSVLDGVRSRGLATGGSGLDR